jgi:uncharacterized membrane protein
MDQCCHSISLKSRSGGVAIELWLLVEESMKDRQMNVGIWFYGIGTVLTGLLNIAWGSFDASHEPIQALSKTLAGEHILASIAGLWLVGAGLATLWRQSVRIGATASGIAYLIFAGLWLARYYAGVHSLGWRIDVLLGITFGLAQQLMLISPAAIIYVFTASTDSRLRKRMVIVARWMLGLPPVIFGIFHLLGIRVFATIVPHWMAFGYFWAALTGVAFILAGCAICSGKMDVIAARLLALMLLVFEVLVEIPPIFSRLHSQPTWGAAAYNLAAVGACLIFAEFLMNRSDRGRIGRAGNVTMSTRDTLVA